MQDLQLEWRIRGVGSADLTWNSNGDQLSLHTTYVGDGLGSIIQAATDLALGSSATFATLPAEPGGTRVFFSGAAEDVFVQVVMFRDLASPNQWWANAEMLWYGRVKVAVVVAQVALMAERILSLCGGARAYATLWGHDDFPTAKLALLNRLLGQR